jgi:hypothetical protein
MKKSPVTKFHEAFAMKGLSALHPVASFVAPAPFSCQIMKNRKSPLFITKPKFLPFNYLKKKKEFQVQIPVHNHQNHYSLP